MPLAPDRPAARLLVWLGVVPFLIFALLFLILPTLQVVTGAFRTPDDAEAQRARLSLLGVQARVTEREQAGRTVFRVRVGPFQNKDAADRVKERLDGNGFDSALVRVQR